MISEKKEETRRIMFRATKSEQDLIQQLADKHTDGNISRWLRFAALNAVPSEKPKTKALLKKKFLVHPSW